jgi:hypothetical protein
MTNFLEELSQNSKYLKSLSKYPNLWKNPQMLLEANKDYNDIKAKNGFIEQMYATLPYELNDKNMSDIRHPLTNYKFMQKYPEDFVRDLGKFKEDADQDDKKPLWDTQEDLINNEFGIDLYKKYPTAPDIIIFDKIIQNAGLPLPLRNNTLYGYITNTADEDNNTLYEYLMK